MYVPIQQLQVYPALTVYYVTERLNVQQKILQGQLLPFPAFTGHIIPIGIQLVHPLEPLKLYPLAFQ